MPLPENLCKFTGQVRSFKSSMVGEFSHLCWGFGKLFLPDPDNNSIGQEIRIQAWEDKALLLSSLKTGTWIKIYCVFQPSMFRGKEMSNFVIGKVIVIDDSK